MTIKTAFLKSKVARRIFALFVLCALIPIIAFAGISFRQVTKQLDEQSKKRLHKTTKSIGMEIYERLLFIETEIRIIGSLYEIGDIADTNIPIEMFGDRLSKKFYGLSIMNGTGDHAPLFGQIKNPPRLSAVEKKHIQTGKVLLSTQKHEENLRRIFVWKILVQKQPEQRILLAEINPNYIWGVSEEGYNTFPPMTELCVLDQSDNLLYASIPKLDSLPEQVLLNIRCNQHSGGSAWKHHGTEYVTDHWLVFLKPIFQISHWTVVLSEHRAEVLAPMSHFNKTFPHVVLLSLVVVFLSSFIQIKKSLLPIEILEKGTRRISEGDFSTEVKISSGDEFEALGDSFNKMSKKISEAQALLIQSAKMGTMGQMAAGIVHEINQPMTAIFSLLQLSLMEEVGHAQRERLEKLEKAVERLMGIVTKFRTFSRRSEEKMVELQINDVIDEVNDLLEHQMQIKRVNCTIDKTEDLPLILGDDNSLQQVFTNLITNAMDALESKQEGDAEVVIRTYCCDNKLCVDVEDNGPGIPDEIQKNIFDPFFTTKSAEKGTGLGLAVIQSILHDHKAQITLESREGVGTLFIVSFPHILEQ